MTGRRVALGRAGQLRADWREFWALISYARTKGPAYQRRLTLILAVLALSYAVAVAAACALVFELVTWHG